VNLDHGDVGETAPGDPTSVPGARRGRPDVAPRRRQARVTRVLIVDDEKLIAEMLAEVIGGEPDMAVVGVAGTVAAATALAARQPDVVLMDYRLPDGTGAAATRLVKARWATARVVMLSALHDDETLMESIQAGADGFLTKESAIDDVVAAVRRVHAGEILLPSAVIGEIAKRVADGRANVATPSLAEPLTARELVILRVLATGASTEAMCERLSVSPNTLRTHTGHILHKCGVHSKLEAVVYGLRHGLLEVPHEPHGR
jgi:DNA-binding NarL/FixJ family response regulator